MPEGLCSAGEIRQKGECDQDADRLGERMARNKRCSSCNRTKPLTAFGREGIDSWCRPCRRTYQRRWLAEHREEYNAKHREYYQRHRDELYRIPGEPIPSEPDDEGSGPGRER